VLAQESSRSQKFLFEVVETGGSSFVGTDGSQGHRRHAMRVLHLRPSDLWTEDRLESRQPKRLRRRLLDLIARKRKE
jgi:hypothetical protein